MAIDLEGSLFILYVVQTSLLFIIQLFKINVLLPSSDKSTVYGHCRNVDVFQNNFLKQFSSGKDLDLQRKP